MDFHWLHQLSKRKKADGLVVPFWKGKKAPQIANDEGASFPLKEVLNSGDFQGNKGEVLYVYVEGLPEKRILLLGLGEKEQISQENLRICFGSLAKNVTQRKLVSLNLIIPEISSLSDEDIAQGIAEGLLLPNYTFNKLKTEKTEEGPTLIQNVTWITSNKKLNEIANHVLKVCEGVYYARDLVNDNADEVTPLYLVACAKQLGKKYPALKVTCWNKKQIEKEKMGLLLAVNRGSAIDPAFIIMKYQGNPKSKDHTVVIGKGITYDTGGLNIKTTGMETMKCDMAGAAACFGLMVALSNLKLKVNVTAVIPATENCVDAKSFKPGDVYKSYLGKTVEMMNSDAEGRLILADALAYVSTKLVPTRIINFATLTGAIDIALGSEASGLMSNDEALAQKLIEAGEKTCERVWRMPLYEEYRERLKSDIADIKSWNGRSAGSCVAAMFLKEFIKGKMPWAHLDIASTALSEGKKYLPKYATGVGVRLMIEFLKTLA